MKVNAKTLLISTFVVAVGSVGIGYRISTPTAPKSLSSPFSEVNGSDLRLAQNAQTIADRNARAQDDAKPYTKAELEALGKEYPFNEDEADGQELEQFIQEGAKRFAEDEPQRQAEDLIVEKMRKDLENPKTASQGLLNTSDLMGLAINSLRLATTSIRPEDRVNLEDALKSSLSAQSLWNSKQVEIESGEGEMEANGLSKDANLIRQNLNESLRLIATVISNSPLTKSKAQSLEQVKAAQGFLLDAKEDPFLRTIDDSKSLLVKLKQEVKQREQDEKLRKKALIADEKQRQKIEEIDRRLEVTRQQIEAMMPPVIGQTEP